MKYSDTEGPVSNHSWIERTSLQQRVGMVVAKVVHIILDPWMRADSKQNTALYNTGRQQSAEIPGNTDVDNHIPEKN